MKLIESKSWDLIRNDLKRGVLTRVTVPVIWDILAR